MKTESWKPFKWADGSYRVEVKPFDNYYIENGWDFHDFMIEMSIHCTMGKRVRKIYTPIYKKPDKEDKSFFIGWCANDLYQELDRDCRDTMSDQMRKITLQSIGKKLEEYFEKNLNNF